MNAPVVFFDSECLFCNSSVRLLLKLDRKKKLFFAPMNGESWNKIFSGQKIDVDSIVVWDGEKIFLRSVAVLKILNALGGIWKFFSFVGKIIPEKIFDTLYDFIARNRYKWFGKAERCIIPSAEERARFLN